MVKLPFGSFGSQSVVAALIAVTAGATLKCPCGVAECYTEIGSTAHAPTNPVAARQHCKFFQAVGIDVILGYLMHWL